MNGGFVASEELKGKAAGMTSSLLVRSAILDHVNDGKCPDDHGCSWDSRDPECPGCRALNYLEAWTEIGMTHRTCEAQPWGCSFHGCMGERCLEELGESCYFARNP